MELRVAKFGGTSLATAETFRKVKEIIKLESSRRFIVVSAPGKCFAGDDKVTDLLYECHRLSSSGLEYDNVFAAIRKRYEAIIAGLNLNLKLDSLFAEIYAKIALEKKPDYIASRGEFLNGIILAEYLGYQFVDAQELVAFNQHGYLDMEKTMKLVSAKLDRSKPAVIPGFYGSTPDGKIKTFSRGGSDITGAIIARALEAKIYENWTDVSGFFMADPGIVENPKLMELITYSELRELAYNGANVLHEAAIFPVSQVGIPINIRNTNDPTSLGTMIVKSTAELRDNDDIIGVAGQKDFVIISIEKALMNSEMGFVRRLLSILEELNISFSHMPSGIDIVSLVILESELKGQLEQVLAMIEERLHPDKVEVVHEIALIATVCPGMSSRCGIAAKLFNALAEAKINVRLIDQGSSGINLIVGVENCDFEHAVRAIYSAFISNQLIFGRWLFQ